LDLDNCTFSPRINDYKQQRLIGFTNPTSSFLRKKLNDEGYEKDVLNKREAD